MNLSNFNAAQLSAYLKGAANQIAETPSKRPEFRPLFLTALNDLRTGVWEAAIHYYPLPYAGDVPEQEVRRIDRAAFLLSQLPGLYRANSTVIKKSIKLEIFKAKTGEEVSRETLYDEFQRGAKEALTLDKFWLHALTHVNPDIRRKAVEKIPKTGNTLSVLLPWMTGDSDVRVRRAAKWVMGIHSRDRSVYRYGANASELVAKAAGGTVTEVELDGMLADGRPTVRYAAALRLEGTSDRWPYLAADPSPRLRRLAAERLPLDAPELRSLAGDPAPTVSSVAGRRLNPKPAHEGKRRYWWSEE